LAPPDSIAVAAPADASRRPDRAIGLSAHGRQLLEQAAAALGQKRMQQAASALGALAALAPQHPEVLRLRAVGLHQQGRFDQAVPLLRRAIEQWPDDSLLYNNLGSALGETGDIEGALEALRRSVELAPELATTWFNLGHALDLHERTEEARQAMREAVERDPQHVHARVGHARILQMTGQIDEAEGEYRRATAIDPESARAWYGLSTLRTTRFDDGDLAHAEHVFARRDASANDRILAGFALAKAYEDHGRHAEAFAVLLMANASRRRRLDWNPAAFARTNRSIAAAFPAAPAPPADDARGNDILFVVSVPRSGSTLVEQILASHAEVSGGNELTDLPNVLNDESRRRRSRFATWARRASAADWERLGSDYLERTARWRNGRRVLVDKALSNWQYIGAARAMLPGARFIDCRRDPVETCLSCFHQLFAREQAYTYDLLEMAAFCREYERLMEHWKHLYPECILTFLHEELLADPESRTRELLEFCGLAFDPACLRPHETVRTVRTASAAQVRTPLRRDTARAAAYGHLLDPLRRALVRAPAGAGRAA
jgi:tetratricopeptide (TPR) repeat protein